MAFKWVTLQVKDMEGSLKFYREIVGLELYEKIEIPDMDIYFLGDEGTKLELIYTENSNEVDMGNSISLGFGVEDLQEKMDFIKKKGIEIHSGPFYPNPSTGFFYVLDPSGLKIQFVVSK